MHERTGPIRRPENGLQPRISIAELQKGEDESVPTQVDDPRLGRIVCRLQLRDIDDMTTHAGRRHEGSIGVVLQLLAMDVGALLLLAPPVSTGRTGAVKGPI